ncbi:MAG TPA: hypothetical protein VF331_15890 [Polyangiales bacterium]
MLDYLNQPRTLVIEWLIGFVIAGLALSVNQRKTADQSCFGSNAGWQTEIAIWNLGASLMLIGVLLSKTGVEAALLPGLFVLSLAFSINHLIALARHKERRYPTNVAAAVANGVGVLVLAVHFIRSF